MNGTSGNPFFLPSQQHNQSTNQTTTSNTDCLFTVQYNFLYELVVSDFFFFFVFFIFHRFKQTDTYSPFSLFTFIHSLIRSLSFCLCLYKSYNILFYTHTLLSTIAFNVKFFYYFILLPLSLFFLVIFFSTFLFIFSFSSFFLYLTIEIAFRLVILT